MPKCPLNPPIFRARALQEQTRGKKKDRAWRIFPFLYSEPGPVTSAILTARQRPLCANEAALRSPLEKLGSRRFAGCFCRNNLPKRWNFEIEPKPRAKKSSIMLKFKDSTLPEFQKVEAASPYRVSRASCCLAWLLVPCPHGTNITKSHGATNTASAGR